METQEIRSKYVRECSYDWLINNRIILATLRWGMRLGYCFIELHYQTVLVKNFSQEKFFLFVIKEYSVWHDFSSIWSLFVHIVFFLKSSNGILSVESGILILFEKTTRGNKFQIELKVVWLPIHTGQHLVLLPLSLILLITT